MEGEEKGIDKTKKKKNRAAAKKKKKIEMGEKRNISMTSLLVNISTLAFPLPRGVIRKWRNMC